MPEPDVLQEVERILAAGRAVPFWVMGGAAIQLQCRSGKGVEALSRVPLDIDLVTAFSSQQRLCALLEELGYVGNERFNALNSRRRLLFYDEENARQIDVFVDRFAMCHELDLIGRLQTDQAGLLPPAELLMTKLQIVKLNQKDLADIAHLLANLRVTTDDHGASINGAQIARVYSQDWGLWRTAMLNLGRLETCVSDLDIDDGSRSVIRGGVRQLERMIETESKSRRWRARARVGDRVRWYQEPEEIGDEIVVQASPEGAC